MKKHVTIQDRRRKKDANESTLPLVSQTKWGAFLKGHHPSLTEIDTFLDTFYLLFERVKSKTYFSGWIYKMNDLLPDGSVSKTRSWDLFYGFLKGSEINLFKTGKFFQQDGNDGKDTTTQVKTKLDGFVNMADGSVNWIGIFKKRYHANRIVNVGVFAVNTAGANRMFFQPYSDDATLSVENVADTMQKWVCAIRLSMFEHVLLSQYFTSLLLNNFTQDETVTGESMEGYLQVRISGDTQWRKFYVLVEKRSNGQPHMLAFPEKKNCEKYLKNEKKVFESRKSSKKYDNPLKQAVFQMINPSSVFSIFPERQELVKCSTLFKIDDLSLLLGEKAPRGFLKNQSAVTHDFGQVVEEASPVLFNFIPSHLMCMASSPFEMIRWIRFLQNIFETREIDQEKLGNYCEFLFRETETDQVVQLKDMKDVDMRDISNQDLIDHFLRVADQKREKEAAGVESEVPSSASTSPTTTESNSSVAMLSAKSVPSPPPRILKKTLTTAIQESSSPRKIVATSPIMPESPETPQRSPKRKSSINELSEHQTKKADYDFKRRDKVATPVKKPVIRHRKVLTSKTTSPDQASSNVSKKVEEESFSSDESSSSASSISDAKTNVARERKELAKIKSELKAEREIIEQQMETLRIMRESAQSEYAASMIGYTQYAPSTYETPQQYPQVGNQAEYYPASNSPMYQQQEYVQQPMFYPSMQQPVNSQYMPSSTSLPMSQTSPMHQNMMMGNTSSTQQRMSGYSSSMSQHSVIVPFQNQPMEQSSRFYVHPQIQRLRKGGSPTPSESASAIVEASYAFPPTYDNGYAEDEEQERQGSGAGCLIDVIAQNSKNRSRFYNPHLGIMQEKQDPKKVKHERTRMIPGSVRPISSAASSVSYNRYPMSMVGTSPSNVNNRYIQQQTRNTGMQQRGPANEGNQGFY